MEEFCEEQEVRGGGNTGPVLDATSSASRVRACEKVLRRFKNRLSKWNREQLDANRNPGDVGAEIEVRVDADQILSMLRQELASGLSGEQIGITELIGQLFLIQVDPDEDEDELATDRLATVLSILDRYAQSPAMCVVLNARGDENRITTHLLDPSIVSGEVFQTVQGGVLMSGTLTPPEMYAESLGIPSVGPLLSLIHI